jgi:hypothetical protein
VELLSPRNTKPANEGGPVICPPVRVPHKIILLNRERVTPGETGISGLDLDRGSDAAQVAGHAQYPTLDFRHGAL